MKTSLKTRPFAAVCGLAVAAAASLALVPAFAEDAAPDKVVATINGTPITEGDLGFVSKQFADQLQQIPEDKRRSLVLEYVIKLRLVAGAAEAAGLDKGQDIARKLAFVRDETLRSEYMQSKVQSAVTDEAVKKRFQEEVAKFVPGDQVHVLHILVKTEDEAKAVVADLDKGGDFAKIAAEKSLDPGSKDKGGDLDFISRGQTVKPFEDAAFALDVGTYTKTPIQSDYGWHVIKVTEKRKEAPPALDERKAANIRDELSKEVVASAMETLRAAAKIEIVPEAPAAAPSAPPAQGEQGAPPKPAQ